ncbi:glycosyltransferase [Microbacterium sp. EYE_5]|uniref:glycosyltransferase family 2 protein n=1 Tax=unclassified Microbacterium TaxID=2609290 RepID=UPI00200670FA|nr:MULTISPECIES: glycosyltransferase [unclassified Microbacterium]MCK6081705.1 glycosyltransferase [Microbacterium sp. EYE_382]MCK6086975.1 glycosyltransferase [Microbacterium sp. EYE_384]MCK6123527.1 glycosyltransferase [Microbacterium sp. EYE_80]MCK6126436.1 glycosyltransferase [Microbacterium sp. EYE_79]MCK6142659.1 glycosyltransferase [Microbacterium sp. EYE_39]
MTTRFLVIRILAVLSVLLGLNYVAWRWLASVNWEAWWIAVPLVIAETYSLVDTVLFAVTMWRARERPRPTAAPQGTVDVFITTYNEPIEMVMATALAAKRITYPHETWILDDGARAELEHAARDAGVGYLTRSADWADKPRHAKAGNLNNALMQTEGEFLLILDADQVPDPLILEHTLGYFADDSAVALVQTPQWFVNVDEADPLGSQAPLFYGPIQQGKDGWNAAFFCGSNAVLRRDALMQLGIIGYVRDLEGSVGSALKTAHRMLRRAAADRGLTPGVSEEIGRLAASVQQARADLALGAPIAELTAAVHAEVQSASRRLVEADLVNIRADVAELANLAVQRDAEMDAYVVDEEALESLSVRELSPLATIGAVDALMDAVRVDRPGEAQPLQPLATISVTEDMATAMQLHALGWKSVYHHEILARGLAPEDLRTMLKQRLRWAQGTMQVLLRDNPLAKKGLTAGQRLMYFGTMWSYLSGFAAVIYLAAPVIYLLLGVLPVTAWSVDFFARFLPYFIVNQILFIVVAKGIRTWRGQQYSLALFPVWIAACVTAFANVVLGRSLNFVVTRKDGRAAGGPPWREIWPQLTAMVLLAIAVVVGIGRVVVGTADGTGTLVNTVWVAYDLVVLSVLIQAARYQGYQPPGESPAIPASREQSSASEEKEPPWTSP